jgi:hypothetical protein
MMNWFPDVAQTSWVYSDLLREDRVIDDMEFNLWKPFLCFPGRDVCILLVPT